MAQINAGDVKYISLRGNKLPNDREIAQLVKGTRDITVMARWVWVIGNIAL